MGFAQTVELDKGSTAERDYIPNKYLECVTVLLKTKANRLVLY